MLFFYSRYIFFNLRKKCKIVIILLPELGFNIEVPNVPYLMIFNLAAEVVRIISVVRQKIGSGEFQEGFFLSQNIFSCYPIPGT